MRWLVAVGLAVSFVTPAEPCAMAPPRGKEAEIVDEEAVIVWDAENHREHFIRKAAFHTNAESIGFLVPTPTTPDLGEIDDHVFRELEYKIAPEVRIERSGFEPGCLLMMGGGKGADTATSAAVHVIQTARVAGFDATTLAATEPTALAGWLGKHGFESTPALTAWLDRYVSDHWQVTAFVVAADQPANGDLGTRSVRMSFSTDRPFYPYREPAQAATGRDRSLRVFVLSTQRYAATLAGKPWVVEPFYAGPITAPKDLVALAGGYPVATVFADTRSPRLGTDEVYFAPSADQSVLHQPDIVVHRYHEVPLEIIPIGLITIIVAWLISRRRRRAYWKGVADGTRPAPKNPSL